MASDSTENSPRVFTATEADAGLRLDVFLAREMNVSRARAQKLLQDATVGGAPVKPSQALRPSDVLELVQGEAAPESPTANEAAAAAELPPIIYEDDHLLILNKPRGVVVHVGAGEQGPTLVDIVRAHGRTLSTVGAPERAGVVHRLDKETSGVMALCKTDAAHWKLAEDFATRKITKEYLALVCGVPRSPGRIEAPIARHPVHRKKMAVAPSGRPATTEYETLKNWQKFAQVKINLLTGRTHQIRVHFQYLNNPVVGDDVYGGHKRALENAPDKAVREAIENLHGQALHAAKLEFNHPITEEKMAFYTPTPPRIQAVIDALDGAGQ